MEPTARRVTLGVVSVAPLWEISGQGRVLAQLLAGPDSGNAVVMSERVPAAGAAADTSTVVLAPERGRLAERLSRRGWRHLGLLALVLETVRRRAREIAAASIANRCEALIACSGSPYDLAATARAARRLGLPFLAYLFDDPIDQWTDPAHRTAARIAARLWCRQAAAILVTNELLAERWRKRHNTVVVVRNPVPVARFAGAGGETAPAFRAMSGGSAIPVVYSGSVYHAQGDAMRNLVAALARLGGKFHLHVFTSQPAAVVEGCGVVGPHVTRHDAVPREAMPGVLHAASVLFLPLGFASGIDEAIRTASPQKLGEYLAAGRPILAHVPPGSFVAAFCRERDCAVVVDRPDAGELVSALERVATSGSDVARLCANARRAAAEFDLDHVRAAFWRTVEESIEQSGRRRNGDRG